jgi:methylmalonyl-CoA/ethylmalonyl-CoA epimerase
MSGESGPRMRLDHIGIAVPDLERARRDFSRLLGSEPSPVEVVEEEQVRLCFFDLGGARLELLEPLSPSSPIARFLERGRSGVHHLSIALEGLPLESFRDQLESRGVELAGREVRDGSGGSRILFAHPRAAASVLIEFTQVAPPPPESQQAKEGA